MMELERFQPSERVLVCFPEGDIEISLGVLSEAGFKAQAFRSMEEVCQEIKAGAGVLLLTEEMIDFGQAEGLKSVLDQQPTWSDLPVVLLVNGESKSEVTTLAVEKLGNITVLERPVSMTTLISVVRSALYARKRQYQVREFLIEQQETAARLEAYNKELEQFAYISSHDLKEPLRKISMYSQILQDLSSVASDSEAQKCLQYILSGAARMNNLIDDLLRYSRIEKEEDHLEKVNLKECADDAVADLEASIKEKGARINIGPMPTLRVNRTMMSQVFVNLIGNAIKYQRDEPPRIDVLAEKENNEWRISVKDNGIGIDPKFRKQVFQVFTRLHSRQKYPGTGIGLAICKKIVERHAGKIWVESEPNKGSTFTFTLPNSNGGSSGA